VVEELPTGDCIGLIPEPAEVILATSLTRNAILAHTRISEIRDVRIPANIPVAPDAGEAAFANAVASLMVTGANGATSMAWGVTGTVGVRLAQQRVDLTIPDPAVAGGVLLEGGFRGQTALDLAGQTISVKLVSGTQQATVISGAFSAGPTFSNTSPGTVPTPVVPANTVVIVRVPAAGVAVEGFGAQLTGNLTIANRVANQSRCDRPQGVTVTLQTRQMVCLRCLSGSFRIHFRQMQNLPCRHRKSTARGFQVQADVQCRVSVGSADCLKRPLLLWPGCLFDFDAFPCVRSIYKSVSLLIRDTAPHVLNRF
jgi:hypothetical protein